MFGLNLDPFTLDGPIAQAVPSFEAVSQIFETLVRTEPGSTTIGPKLARSWDTSDGQTWTFHLRQGVKFHDGTPFDAKAVCFNFERWYHFTGVQQHFAKWQYVFGAFATPSENAPPETLYAGCDAAADDRVVLRLTHPYGGLLPALTSPAFSIASPDALQRYEADKVTAKADSPVINSVYGEQHPTGTGPFRFKSWTRNERIELVRNPDYWGPKAKPERIIFRPITDGAARRQALESGEIQGYVPVEAGDVKPLRDEHFSLVELPAMNVGYVGLNLTKPPLDNLKVRQAVAHALNRDAMVKAKFAAGTETATQVIPPSLPGHGAGVPEYRYDPELAKRLLTESGVPDPTLEFWYPMNNPGDPAIPDPEGMFLAFKADLERVGFRVVGKPTPAVPDYFLKALPNGDAQVFFAGYYASRPSSEELLSAFEVKYPPLGFNDQEVIDAVRQAKTALDDVTRATLYEKANRLIMGTLYLVPYAHVKIDFALSPKVHGFTVSAAATDPDFTAVTIR